MNSSRQKKLANLSRRAATAGARLSRLELSRLVAAVTPPIRAAVDFGIVDAGVVGTLVRACMKRDSTTFVRGIR